MFAKTRWMVDTSVMRNIEQVVVIFNPKSTKAKKGLVAKFKRQLTKAAPKIKLTILETTHHGHAEELAKKYCNDTTTVVVAASGDGVYSEVLNGILSSPGDHPPLGIIPIGNANDHFHAIAKGSMIDRIVKAKYRKLDVLRVELTSDDNVKKTRFAHSYIGFGITPYIRTQLDEKKINYFTEKIVAVRSFVESKPIRIERLSEKLEVDSLLFTNIKVIAKFFKVKNSKPDDGKYEVHITHHSTQLHKAGDLIRMGTKRSTMKSRSTAYAFTLLESSSMQVDGEVIKLKKNSRIVVSLIHDALETVI